MRVDQEPWLGRSEFLAKLQSVGKPEANGTSTDFLDLLMQGVDQVNRQQAESHDQVQQLLSGQDVNAAEVMTGIQKADLSFRLLVQIRNKLMQAYEEINAIRV
jgi:flagellar hook-basal body complex protein FliE